MLENFKFLKDNLVLFSTGCYGIGFVYIVVYFGMFNIPIIHYIDLNDLLLFAIKIIMPAVIIGLIYETVVKGAKLIVQKINSLFRQSAISESVLRNCFFLISTIFFLFILIFYRRSLINPEYFLIGFLSLITIFIVEYRTVRSKISRGLTMLLFLLFTSAIFFMVNQTKHGLVNLDVKFRYNSRLFNTSYYSDFNYIGETSKCIFLSNYSDQKSYVFEKEKVTELVYLNKIENWRWFEKEITVPKFILMNLRKDDTIKANLNQWKFLRNEAKYEIDFEMTPQGAASAYRNIKDILMVNQFDIEIPAMDYSILPSEVNLSDYKKLDELLKLGDYKIEQIWTLCGGDIVFNLDNKRYHIEITINNSEKRTHYPICGELDDF